MGLKINVALTPHFACTAILPAGVVIKYNATFAQNRVNDDNGAYSLKYEIHYNMEVYENQSAFEAGSLNIQAGVKEFYIGHVQEITKQQHDAIFTNANAGAIVEGFLIAYLESKIGSGNITHIDFTI